MPRQNMIWGGGETTLDKPRIEMSLTLIPAKEMDFEFNLTWELANEMRISQERDPTF